MRRTPGNLGQGEGWQGDPKSPKRLIGELDRLRGRLLAFEEESAHRVHEVHRAYEISARNLLHYVALRQQDTRALRDELETLGLSPFSECESHVMADIDAVLELLRRAAGAPAGSASRPRPPVRHGEAAPLIETHTESLLGEKPARRKVRFMVTLPAEAAGDYALVRDLIAGGMDVARINCAHDDAAAWRRMVANIRRAQRERKKLCRILMDLAGPKLRTGELEPGPRVLRWRPRRDALGRVVTPARVWLTPSDAPEPAPAGAATLPVSREFLKRLRKGSVLSFTDARQRDRTLTVTSRSGASLLAEGDRTAYVTPGIELSAGAAGGKSPPGVVGELPVTEQALDLAYGDILVLTADPAPGRNATKDAAGIIVSPARAPCTLPEIFADVRPAERIWFDDGRIGGVVESAAPEEIRVRIVRGKPTGNRLRADKGINLPDSRLRVKGLTNADSEDLKFIAGQADLVALSFLRAPEDVRELQDHLESLGAGNLGIMLKIETRQALDALPAILLAAMRTHPIGVMIARGDLAVECGYERLAEAQEEILSLCEASHVPVVWATQVLENLTRQGLPSRAEITDAAMSVRAECVMLNKGPYILDSLRVLDDILQRMEPQASGKSRWLDGSTPPKSPPDEAGRERIRREARP